MILLLLGAVVSGYSSPNAAARAFGMNRKELQAAVISNGSYAKINAGLQKFTPFLITQEQQLVTMSHKNIAEALQSLDRTMKLAPNPPYGLSVQQFFHRVQLNVLGSTTLEELL